MVRVMRRWTSWRLAAVVLVAFMSANAVLAQESEPPSKKETRSASERAAYDKAMCIYRGMTEAGKVFASPFIQEKLTPEVQARAQIELEQWAVTSKAAARACLTEQEVYDLGRYSYLEDMAFSKSAGCHLTRAPAARFERTPNNSDGDIVNGAVKWEAIPENGPIEGHAFFKGQSEAREEFGEDRDAICLAIVDEYGPKGERFPGMVRKR